MCQPVPSVSTAEYLTPYSWGRERIYFLDKDNVRLSETTMAWLGEIRELVSMLHDALEELDWQRITELLDERG